MVLPAAARFSEGFGEHKPCTQLLMGQQRHIPKKDRSARLTLTTGTHQATAVRQPMLTRPPCCPSAAAKKQMSAGARGAGGLACDVAPRRQEQALSPLLSVRGLLLGPFYRRGDPGSRMTRRLTQLTCSQFCLEGP